MMWDGETDALFVPASLLASPSRRNARRLNSREQPRQRRRLKCPIWKRAAACWPPMHPLLLKGAIGLEVKDYLYKLLRSRTLDKLIVASLLRHWDSDRTPHVRHVNLKVLPKLHTRGLFWARKSRPWSLLSSAGFARAPLSEWQGADSRRIPMYNWSLPRHASSGMDFMWNWPNKPWTCTNIPTVIWSWAAQRPQANDLNAPWV